MDPSQQLRNLRDFLLVYNRMTEICFQRCTSNFNYRNLTMDEERCADSCAGKLIRSNHRLMGTYVDLMPRMVQRRMEEMESKAAENAKAAEAAAATAAAASASSENVEPPAIETAPASQSFITSSPPVPPLLTPSVTDAGPEASGLPLKPAGIDIPLELDAPVSKISTVPEINLSAATVFTPAAQAGNLSVLNDAGSGPSFATGSPQMLIPGAHIEFESSAPAVTASSPASISADVPVSVAAPIMSTETQSIQQKEPELPPAPAQ